MRLSKKDTLTEIEIDNLISSQIDSKSFELIEGIKNELIDQGKIRLTARQEYGIDYKDLSDKQEYHTSRKFNKFY